jgi:RNA polymerase sigma-70 factor (TIGR02960 family)
VSEQLLTRAVAGDEQAFSELTDPHRRELHVHCYRILGSMQDAEDALQETLLAAWRGLARFEGRASLRAWLYQIATNRCLNALRDAGRRPPPPVAPPFEPPKPTRLAEPTWLEPYPDAMLEGVSDASAGPHARYETRETVELAFIAALQQLPARQRVVLVLRDVLGFHATEVATMLGSSEDSVKGALKRARATLDQHRPARDRAPARHSAREREIVRRFVDAFEADDVDAIVALLTEDAWVTMPPSPLEYQGRAAIDAFLRQVAAWHAGKSSRRRLVPTRANSQPAFGCYRLDANASVAHATGLIVLTLEGDRIAAYTQFLDSSILAPFGLPRTLPA